MNHIEDGIVAAADAQSLGGKAPEYYLQPRNLLDNSDFTNAVNQRGANSYSGSVYSIDRWKLWTTATTLTINDGYITNAEREMVQLLESVDTTKTYTLAGCTSDGVIHILQGKFDGNNYVDAYLRFVGDSSVYCVGLKPNSWVWAALYEGVYTADTLPPYIPKGYAAELAECQRYFWRCNNTWLAEGTGYAFSDTEFRVSIVLPQIMRVTPTMVSSTGDTTSYGIKIRTSGKASIAPNAVTLALKNNRIALTLTGNFTNGELGVLRLENDYLDFSADL